MEQMLLRICVRGDEMMKKRDDYFRKVATELIISLGKALGIGVCGWAGSGEKSGAAIRICGNISAIHLRAGKCALLSRGGAGNKMESMPPEKDKNLHRRRTERERIYFLIARAEEIKPS